MITVRHLFCAVGALLTAVLVPGAETEQTSYQQLMNQAQERIDVWSDAKTPVRLEAVAKVKNGKGSDDSTVNGVVEWTGWEHYRIYSSHGSERKLYVRDGARVLEFPARTAKTAPALIDLDSAMSALLPKRPLQGTALPVRIKETKVNGRTLLCLEQPTRYFCVEPSTGALAYRVFGGRELEFRDYKPFRGKLVPTSFRAYSASDLTTEGTFKWSELETPPETLRLPDAAEWREHSDSCKADGSKPSKVRISSGVAAQRITNKVPPRYPMWAKSDRVMGKVILKATIARDGSVQNLIPISSPREDLTNAAADAVRQWKYLPYFLCDEPVEVETQVEITFTLVG